MYSILLALSTCEGCEASYTLMIGTSYFGVQYDTNQMSLVCVTHLSSILNVGTE